MSAPTDNNKFNFFKEQTEQLYRQAAAALGKKEADKLFGAKEVIMATGVISAIDWRLYKDFSRSEFECHCGCGEADMNPELLDRLQEIRTFINRPINILSGFRCKFHNNEVGGDTRSAHLAGDAADIQVYGSTHRHLLLKALIDAGFNRIGIYKTFIHADVSVENPQDVIWYG